MYKSTTAETNAKVQINAARGNSLEKSLVPFPAVPDHLLETAVIKTMVQLCEVIFWGMGWGRLRKANYLSRGGKSGPRKGIVLLNLTRSLCVKERGNCDSARGEITVFRGEALAVSSSFRRKSPGARRGLWVLWWCSSAFEGLTGLLEIYGDRRSYSEKTTIVAGHLFT